MRYHKDVKNTIRLTLLNNRPVCQLQLPNGRMTVFDAKDLNTVEQHRWQYSSGYAKAQVERKKRGQRHIKYIYLHRLLASAERGQLVDHENTNSLDNRSANLRLSNKSLNGSNTHKAKGRSGVRGVIWNRQRNNWQVVLFVERKPRHFGFYTELSDAKDRALAERKKIVSDR